MANLGNTSGNRQINLSEAQEFTMNITGNTTFSFTNAPGAGESQVVYLRLQNAGSRTINWPTSTSFEEGSAPELTESGTDILGVKYDTATSTYMVFMLGRDVK